MQTRLELRCHSLMRGAGPGDAGLAGEGGAHHAHRIMRLPARPGAGVPGMLGAVILHRDLGRGEGLLQARLNAGGAVGHDFPFDMGGIVGFAMAESGMAPFRARALRGRDPATITGTWRDVATVSEQ